MRDSHSYLVLSWLHPITHPIPFNPLPLVTKMDVGYRFYSMRYLKNNCNSSTGFYWTLLAEYCSWFRKNRSSLRPSVHVSGCEMSQLLDWSPGRYTVCV